MLHPLSAPRTIAAAVVVLSILAGAGCYSYGPRATPTPGPEQASADLDCSRASAPPPREILGINLGNQKINRLSEVSALGIEWVRADVPWGSVETGPGILDWTAVDSAIADVQRRGIQLEVVIGHPPEWAWSRSDADFAAAAGSFAHRIVDRYRPGGDLAREREWTSFGVSVWSVFNEPNLPGYGWGERGDDARSLLDRYIATLGAVNAEVRRADDAASIVLGGLSSNSELRAEEVLEAIGESGAEDCVDIVAFHPYGYEGRLTAARDRMRISLHRSGLGDVPLWFDEIGTNNESLQSELVAEAVDMADEVDAVFWFSLTDFDQFDGRYGVLRGDGSRKPIFDQLAQLAAT